MNRALSILAAVGMAAGLCWTIAAFMTFEGAGIPFAAKAAGPLAFVASFPALYRFAGRHEQERWDAGAWVPATGTVTSVDWGEDSGSPHLTLRLHCREHGSFKARVLFDPEQADRQLYRKGTTVDVHVRSNDRSRVELVSLAGYAPED